MFSNCVKWKKRNFFSTFLEKGQIEVNWHHGIIVGTSCPQTELNIPIEAATILLFWGQNMTPRVLECFLGCAVAVLVQP